MIIRGKLPPLLPSSYPAVINRNDNKRLLIEYTWIAKGFICENNKNTRLCYGYAKVNKYFHYILQIYHGL